MDDDKTKLTVVPKGEKPARKTAAAKTTAVTKITKSKLPAYQEQQLLDNATSILPKAFQALERNLDKSDLKAVEKAFQLYGMMQQPGSPSIINQIYNSNQQNNANIDRRNFESLVKRYEEADNRVIDAEPVGS